MDPSGFQELLEEFILEARERADEVESLMLRIASGDMATREAAIAQAKRELHTLKGNAGMMGFSELQQLAHHLEDEVEGLDLAAPDVGAILAGIDTYRQGMEAQAPEAAPGAAEPATVEVAAAGMPATGMPATGMPATGMPATGMPAAGTPATDTNVTSVRVPFSKIDHLVELQAETLIFRNRLSDAVQQGLARVREAAAEGEGFSQQAEIAWEAVEEARQALEKTLNQLQEQVTELGMVPLQSLFRSLGRIVHDESSREKKKVTFEVTGGETPIDKALLEVSSEVLGHLVRNAVIHGVESPEARRRQGKPETGRVRLAAALEGGEIRIEVADDGGGIDFEALAAKAGEDAAELGTGPSRYAMIFADGVSTRADADLGSGRGVGLSAVKRSIDTHGGQIEVRSERHAGSAFVLRLPLTTSILRALLVHVDGEEYALPLTAVTESQRLEGLQMHELNHAPVVPWRGRLIPLLDLGLAFGTAPEIRRAGYFIIIDVNRRQRGLAIDEIVGIRDIVVKGLDKIVGQPTGISGSTILGDGRVIMILDPNELIAIPPFTGAEP